MESKSFINLQLKHGLQGPEGPFHLNLKLSLKRGEILAVSGKSGAGKTSLLRIIAGLLRPDEGFLEIEQKRWIDSTHKISLAPQARSVGMVFQDYALFPHMTVLENLFFALKRGEDRQWPQSLLKKMDLWELKDRKPQQLSGGQKQRVAIIRALVQKPQLLLLDEPLSALDENLRRQIQQDLLHLHQQLEITSIWVSHSIVELSSVADRVLLLEKGKIQKLGPPEEILQQGKEGIWEGEILKILGKGEYWVRVGNNPYKLFLRGEKKVGDKIRIKPTIMP